MELPKRKPNRLQKYDYSSPGAYFITLCTHNRKKVLCDIVGEGLRALPQIRLTPIGKKVELGIQYMEDAYPSVFVDRYVIMSNHVHLLVSIKRTETGTGGHGDPPLQTVIGRFKSYTTYQYDGILWQRSFHDHIIRDEKDYQMIYEYIDNNPQKWQEDCFYAE